MREYELLRISPRKRSWFDMHDMTHSAFLATERSRVVIMALHKARALIENQKKTEILQPTASLV